MSRSKKLSDYRERAKRAYEIGRKRAEASREGALLHADMVQTRFDETTLEVAGIIAALVGTLRSDDFLTGFMAAELHRKMLVEQRKKH